MKIANAQDFQGRAFALDQDLQALEDRVAALEAGGGSVQPAARQATMFSQASSTRAGGGSPTSGLTLDLADPESGVLPQTDTSLSNWETN